MDFRRRRFYQRGGRKDYELNQEEENFDDMLVFGYPCSIFRDDERATWIDSGQHLIRSPVDDDLTFDRTLKRNKCFQGLRVKYPKLVDDRFKAKLVFICSYDCRLLLSNIKDAERQLGNDDDGLNDEERLEQILCDEERYKDLTAENATEQDSNENASTSNEVDAESRGNAVPFNYETENSNSVEEKNAQDEEEFEVEPFVPVPELRLPADMTTPSSSSQNYFIVKTASFIATQGPQMEIIINAKQKSNERFRFLDYENPLHKYYKHVLKMIREKKYSPDLTPIVLKKKQQQKDSSDEEDSDGGEYLHPSLMGKTAAATASPQSWPNAESTYKIGQESDVYSQLYNRLSIYMPKKPVPEEETSIDSNSNISLSQEDKLAEFIGEEASSASDEKLTVSVGVVPPPPDLQPIIDRLAEYVARNGVDFENVVRDRRDERFQFLEPTNVYFAYYRSKISWFQYETYMSNVYHGGGGGSGAPPNNWPPTCQKKTVVVPTKPLIEHPWCAPSTSDTQASVKIDAQAKMKADAQAKVKNKGTKNKSITISLKTKESSKGNGKEDKVNDMKSETQDLAVIRENGEVLSELDPGGEGDSRKEKTLQSERRMKAKLFVDLLKKSKELSKEKRKHAEDESGAGGKRIYESNS